MFITEGAITDLGGGAVPGFAEVECSVWPTGNRTTQTGEAYDYIGEADIDARDELAKPNRRLMVDGNSYVIVAVTAMEILPHCSLRLRRVGSAGGV